MHAFICRKCVGNGAAPLGQELSTDESSSISRVMLEKQKNVPAEGFRHFLSADFAQCQLT
jgi:hypothetical protein